MDRMRDFWLRLGIELDRPIPGLIMGLLLALTVLWFLLEVIMVLGS